MKARKPGKRRGHPIKTSGLLPEPRYPHWEEQNYAEQIGTDLNPVLISQIKILRREKYQEIYPNW